MRRVERLADRAPVSVADGAHDDQWLLKELASSTHPTLTRRLVRKPDSKG